MDSPSKNVFDHVNFRHDLPVQYMCVVCKNPVLEAEMATPCGHSFCGFCVECFKTQGRDKACQLCKIPVSSFCKNLLAGNMLNLEKGQCRWCQEEFPLDDAKNHVRRCDQLEVPCGKCKRKVKRADELQHQLVCEESDIVCACGTLIKKKDEDKHREKWCNFLEVPCPLKCGQLIKRLLIPTHSLRCSAVVTECAVKECHKIVRRGDVHNHISEDQMHHYNLLEEEKRNILWEWQKKVLIDMKTKSTGEVGVFEWNLLTRPRGLLCSPEFHKFDRKWRLLLNDKAVALEFSQGVKLVHMDLSFIVKSSDGKIHGYILRTVELAEGTMATHTLKMPMDNVRNITAKLELLEPQIN